MHDALPDPVAVPAPGTVILYDSYDGNEGHRAEYYALFTRMIGSSRTNSMMKALFSRKPVLVGHLEASLARYTLIALFRTLLGRRTAGFLFRPLQVIEAQSPRMRFKRLVLSLLRRLPNVRTLTILPFSLEPRFAEIASGWIYDPQFWDLHFPDAMESTEAGDFAQGIRQVAAGRRICCAIGRQDIGKGFDQFVRLYVDRADLRDEWLCAFGGGVDAKLGAELKAFEDVGGFACARFIEHEELLDLYACADAIWCSYADQYDQASGIFGRAIQLGIPVVVRKGSLIHRYCEKEGLSHIAYDRTPANFDFSRLPPFQDRAEAARRAVAQGTDSLQRLREALGLL